MDRLLLYRYRLPQKITLILHERFERIDERCLPRFSRQTRSSRTRTDRDRRLSMNAAGTRLYDRASRPLGGPIQPRAIDRSNTTHQRPGKRCRHSLPELIESGRRKLLPCSRPQRRGGRRNCDSGQNLVNVDSNRAGGAQPSLVGNGHSKRVCPGPVESDRAVLRRVSAIRAENRMCTGRRRCRGPGVGQIRFAAIVGAEYAQCRAGSVHGARISARRLSHGRWRIRAAAVRKEITR